MRGEKARNYVQIDLVSGKAALFENYRKVLEGDVETILRKIGLL